MKLSISAAALLPLLANAAPPCPKSCSPKPAAFFLAGDSTTAVQSEGGGGWGNGFLSFLVPPATGTNYGRNGRTTVDFVTGGYWDLVTAAVRQRAADFDVYVTIQFGHNDQKPAKNITLDMYQENLGRLAGEIKALGATPILVTPLSRRNFKGDMTDDSLKNERIRTIAAAEETRTQFIDLYKNSKALVEAVGEQRSHDEWNLKAGDNTHLNDWGSVVFGRLVADLILEKEACLKGWIGKNETLSDEIWRNKNFATGEIPVDIAFESARLDEDGNWEITWRNNIPRFAAAGLNTSVFTPEQLLTALKPGFKTAHLAVLQNHTSWNPKVWSRSTLYPREISWENWMAGKASFAAAVAELAESGLVFITGVPKKHDSVKRVALQFGGLKETFYGNTWDVVSKPQAENVAYTSEYLGLHSDMLYLNSPPKLQFLHCLENDAVGGESLFSDAMRTAAEMISQKPEMAEVLGEVNMGWHYDNNGFFYQQSRPVFQGMGKVSPDTTNPQEGSEQLSSNRRQASRNTRRTLPTDVWWSPPFQTPLRAPTTPEARKRYGEWLAAASTFQNMLEDEANMIRRRLRAGDCVVFDNRRVLHGRTAFDASSGGRHLRGAYVDIDEWRSTLKRVEREYELPAFLKARGEALQAWTKAEHAQPATQEVDESGAEVRASVSA
ncbi:hypothetical protein ACHAQH_009394 [Verticillium albo-atrum]